MSQSFSVEEFLKMIGDHLASILLRDLNTSIHFAILADESTDDGDQSQLAIFVCLIGSHHRPIEDFLGITRIAILKTTAAIMDTISNFLISKEVQPYIRFCGLNRTILLVSVAVSNILSNILCRIQSIPIAIITSLHWALFSYLKNFLHLYHLLLCSSMYESCLSTVPIRKEFFNIMQHVYELNPLKAIKACTTWLLTHGEACWTIPWFELLVDALKAIYNEKRCPDVQWVTWFLPTCLLILDLKPFRS